MWGRRAGKTQALLSWNQTNTVVTEEDMANDYDGALRQDEINARVQAKIKELEMRAFKEAMNGDFSMLHRINAQRTRRETMQAHYDESRRLHSDLGPALITGIPGPPSARDPLGTSFHGVREQFYWHGTEVPAYVILEPDTITVWSIEQEENAEVRRCMIERYLGRTPETDQLDGYGRYIRDCKAECIDDDPRFGKLWRRALSGDEPIHMVEVLNATVEKDGTRHRFFLRVPPDTRTARQAVAWTFGMKSAEYVPEAES